MQREADLKKSIDNSDSNQLTLALKAASNETAKEKRVREFACGEVSYEAFDSWNIYLKEKSQKFRENAANSKKKG